MSQYKQQIKDLREELKQQKALSANDLQKRIKDLEQQLEQSKRRHAQELNKVKAELERTKGELKWERDARVRWEGEAWDLKERYSRKGRSLVIPG